MDCLKALEALVTNAESTPVSEIVTSAQDLARHSTKLIGGFTLPDFKSDPSNLRKGKPGIGNCNQLSMLTMSCRNWKKKFEQRN